MTGSRTPNTRLRILIVDDYRDAADALATFIEHVGHEVAVAYGGIEALAVADRFAPDMVFLDLNMPQMDGYAVARVFRQTWPGPLLLVAHSAQGMQSDIDAAFAAGFDHHLLKPAEATALLALIEQGLAQIGRP